MFEVYLSPGNFFEDDLSFVYFDIVWVWVDAV